MDYKDYKITVLITFYNQENYVDRTLNSVMTQNTNFPFKVIIGDDGSSDGTVDNIKKWTEKFDNIEYIIQDRSKEEKHIGGVRASRNRLSLMNKVTTPYFIFLDGDDCWTDKEKLQIQYDILQKESNKDCIGCAHIIKRY